MNGKGGHGKVEFEGSSRQRTGLTNRKGIKAALSLFSGFPGRKLNGEKALQESDWQFPQKSKTIRGRVAEITVRWI
jgi:hypothetical protein